MNCKDCIASGCFAQGKAWLLRDGCPGYVPRPPDCSCPDPPRVMSHDCPAHGTITTKVNKEKP